MRRVWLLGMSIVLAGCAGEQSPGVEAGEPTPRPSRTVEIRAGDQLVDFTPPSGGDAGYLLHAPESFPSDGRLPLVLVFHGAPGTPQEMVRSTGFNVIADEESFLVAYPDSIDRSDDIAALIDDVSQRVAVDPRRIYATGFSRGASTTYVLASELPDRIAAFAPVSGVSYELPPGGPTSLITFQGTEDPAASAFPAVNSRWSETSRCARPRVTTLTLAGRPTRRSVAGCRSGTDHVVYRVEGMGHAWPHGASRLIWEFFEAHPLAR